MSVLLVPHSSGRIRVIKISGLYAKLSILFAVVLLSMLSLSLLAIHATSERNKLVKSVAALEDINSKQQELLSDKAGQLSELNQKNAEISESINGFMEKYKEITDKYIASRASTLKASRSGTHDDSTFINDINSLRAVIKDLKDISGEDAVAFSGLKETEKKLKSYMDSLPTLWPAKGEISSNFGGRRDPITYHRSNHKGLDIAADYGQNILAAGSGTVSFTGWYNEYGRAVIIDHGNGLTTVYGHTSKILVKKGQKVKKGVIIAKVGSSGRSTGSHLHFEVRAGGNPLNPLKYLGK